MCAAELSTPQEQTKPGTKHPKEPRMSPTKEWDNMREAKLVNWQKFKGIDTKVSEGNGGKTILKKL